MFIGKICHSYKTFYEKDLFVPFLWNVIDENNFIETLNMYNYIFNKRYVFLSDSTEIIYSIKDSGDDVLKVVTRKYS